MDRSNFICYLFSLRPLYLIFTLNRPLVTSAQLTKLYDLKRSGTGANVIQSIFYESGHTVAAFLNSLKVMHFSTVMKRHALMKNHRGFRQIPISITRHYRES